MREKKTAAPRPAPATDPLPTSSHTHRPPPFDPAAWDVPATLAWLASLPAAAARVCLQFPDALLPAALDVAAALAAGAGAAGLKDDVEVR